MELIIQHTTKPKVPYHYSFLITMGVDITKGHSDKDKQRLTVQTW